MKFRTARLPGRVDPGWSPTSFVTSDGTAPLRWTTIPSQWSSARDAARAHFRFQLDKGWMTWATTTNACWAGLLDVRDGEFVIVEQVP